MDIEDFQASLAVRQVDHNLAVKSTGPHQGRIQNLRSIGGRHHNYPAGGFKAIHLRQQLVESLLALFVSSHGAYAGSLSSNSINLIDENDGWSSFFGLIKQITHPRCAYPDKHFHKLGAA